MSDTPQQIVYVLIEGEYSDASPTAVFSDRYEAEASARVCGGYVAEVDFNPPLSKKAKRKLRPGESIFSVWMDRDGTDAGCCLVNPRDDPGGIMFVRFDEKRIAMDVFARDGKHAIKIVNDKRAQWVAGGSRVVEGSAKCNGWSRARFT